MESTQKITPCLWFDVQAEVAVEFYTDIFRNSKILNISRYGEAGHEIHGKPEGTVMTIALELEGQAFTALNATVTHPSAPLAGQTKYSTKLRLVAARM